MHSPPRAGRVRWALALAVLATLALATTGCRQDSGRSSPPTAIEPQTTIPESEEYCGNARAFVVQILDLVTVDWSQGDAVALYATLESFLQSASGLVPQHLRPKAALAATALASFRASLDTAGYDLERVDPAAWMRVNSSEFSAAIGELADYSRRACGLPT